jgi:hypothetical protein
MPPESSSFGFRCIRIEDLNAAGRKSLSYLQYGNAVDARAQQVGYSCALRLVDRKIRS